MTTVERDTSAAATAPPRAASAGSWWDRFLNLVIPGRRAAIERHERMTQLAEQNPPPQRWYDEDFMGLRAPRQS